MESLPDDLLAPDVNANPHPFMAALRERDPVHWSSTHNAWLISRYEDVHAALTDRRLSCERIDALEQATSPVARDDTHTVLSRLRGWMVLSDPPEHTRLRRLASAAFTPTRVAAMQARIGLLVDELLDAIVHRPRFDFVADFASPLPATVIAELLGAPPEDRGLIKSWSDDLALVAFGAGGPQRAERHRRALRGLDELLSYFDELIERARRSPRADVVSALLQGDGKGDRLERDELRAMCALLLFAGHETTTSTLSSALLALTRHPDQLRLLCSDPQLTGAAIEEALRFDGVVKVLIRSVSEDFELHGRKIESGQRVFLLPAAANRDPERFVDPNRFDLTRSPNPHLAFGRGVHACIGAQLARLELRIALARVLERLPNIRLAAESELRWERSLASRALERLELEHDAGSGP